MTLNYDDIATDRRARLSPDTTAQREVFFGYSPAELRGLTLDEAKRLLKPE